VGFFFPLISIHVTLLFSSFLQASCVFLPLGRIERLLPILFHCSENMGLESKCLVFRFAGNFSYCFSFYEETTLLCV
jgi:hypothetical protein